LFFFSFSNSQHVFLGGEKENKEESKKSLPAPLCTPPVNTRLTTVTGVGRRIECRLEQWHSALCGHRKCHLKRAGGAHPLAGA